MQLILEKEPAIDITSNMSTLEDSLDKKIIMNGIIENLVQDVNMGNKENINKSVNLIGKDHENQKVNNFKCTEEESLEDPSVDINKIENEECNMLATEKDIKNNSKECIQNELVAELSEATIKIENVDDNTRLTVEEFIENNPEQLNIEPSYTNADIHNHDIVEQQNVCVKMDENCEDSGKEIILNNHFENPEEQLIQINKEVNEILKKEVLSFDQHNTPAQTEVECNSEVKKDNIDHCQLYTEDEAIKDLIVEQEVKENKNDELFNEVTIDTAINNNVDKIINSKLNQLLQPNAEEVFCEQNKNLDEEINNKKSNVVEKLTDIHLKNDYMVRNISTDNENKETIPTDISDYGNNDDNENSKLEAMDVEFLQEDNDNKNLHEIMDVDNVNHPKSSESVIENLEDSSSSNNIIDSDEVTEVTGKEASQDVISLNTRDDVMVVDEDKKEEITKEINHETVPEVQVDRDSEKSPSRKTPICRLSNTLDILSDDDDEQTDSSHEIDPSNESETDVTKILETGKKESINVEDDDDIVVIDEDIGNKTETDYNKGECSRSDIRPENDPHETDTEAGENKSNFMESIELSSVKNSKEPTSHTAKTTDEANQPISEGTESKKPLVADGFLNSTKKRLADMTREELEEFCVLKIVESIVDRSNLSEIKLKLKTMAQSFEEYSKKAMVLYKQNRDLQVVLKSIQEEQKKATNAITPLKITRSVGMQVLMIEKSIRKKGPAPTSQVNNNKTRSPLNQSPRPHKSVNNNIPVPRLIPAINTTVAKGPTPQNSPNNAGKQAIPVANGVRTSLPTQKLPEKRPLNKSQSTDCVDLTDDEPPTKMISRSPTAPVRLVPPQNLLAPQRAQFGQVVNSPRKVYIPISSPQSPNIRPGQTFMVKAAGPRARGPTPILPRMTQNQIRLSRATQGQGNRHPAPLPDAMKQYQPPNWKALPPAPDLKLSKVENGIVISWKIEGYQEDSYEDIASYQLYAYQETSSPPSTALWKKIGDVKALPLPMACTLTQFMSGFKYYFAVRAVDVRSRLGPFSLPGSILLLNKM